MKKRLMGLLIMLIFIVSFSKLYSAPSYYFSDYNISIFVTEKEILNEEITFTIKNMGEDMEYITYYSVYPINNIHCYDLEGDLEYIISEEKGEKKIKCKFRKVLKKDEEYRITISFDTDALNKTKEGKYIFSPIFNFPCKVENFELVVKVPSTMSFVSPITPKPSGIKSEGRSLIIFWNKDIINEEFYIILGISKTMEKEGDNNLVFIYILLAFISGLFLGCLFKFTRKKGTNFLKEDEEVVMDLIKEKGKITQREIRERTNFSKSKVSRLLMEMEQRDLIEKEKYKKTYIVKLKE